MRFDGTICTLLKILCRGYVEDPNRNIELTEEETEILYPAEESDAVPTEEKEV